MIRKTHWNYDTALLVQTPDGMVRDAVVSKLPVLIMAVVNPVV
jgi:hypothetical protein